MSNEYNLFEQEDSLITNPTARVPICLCLDTSGSMNAVESGETVATDKTVNVDGRDWYIVDGGVTRLMELQEGIEQFYHEIREDEVARYSAEICVVDFNNTAHCIMEYGNVDNEKDIPKLKANGITAMGEGVNLALDLLDKRKHEYQEKGVDYFQPWLILMTDGEPNGDQAELDRAIERVNNLVNDRKMTIFPIGIGKEADLELLKKFSPNRQPLRLKGMKFKEFFAWLSQSVSRTSQSMPGESVKLDMDGVLGWGEL